MASTSSPYGMVSINLIGGQSFNGGGIRDIVMTVNSATGFFFGDLVNITAGQPTPIAATPTTTADGNTPVGTFVGCSYVDPALKYVSFAQFLPANAVSSGYTNIRIRVSDDPDTLFKVQASGSVTRASIGLNAPLTNFGNGSTVTGNSKVQLLAASIGAGATLAVRIVDLVDMQGFSTPGDAFTDCIVKFNQGVHAYLNPTGQ